MTDYPRTCRGCGGNIDDDNPAVEVGPGLHHQYRRSCREHRTSLRPEIPPPEPVTTIPVAVLERIADAFPELHLEQIVFIALGDTQPDDTATIHVTTWGRSYLDKFQAAGFGDGIRSVLGHDVATVGDLLEDFRRDEHAEDIRRGMMNDVALPIDIPPPVDSYTADGEAVCVWCRNRPAIRNAMRWAPDNAVGPLCRSCAGKGGAVDGRDGTYQL